MWAYKKQSWPHVLWYACAMLSTAFLIYHGGLSREKRRERIRKQERRIVETRHECGGNLECNNVGLELQALQVNARLREAKSWRVYRASQREHSEKEELLQSLHEACEGEIQVQQEKESLSVELVSVKQWLEETTKRMLQTKRTARVEGNDLLNRAQTEIMEFLSITGRLQLELKCTLNEKELCTYQLAEERNKAHVLIPGIVLC